MMLQKSTTEGAIFPRFSLGAWVLPCLVATVASCTPAMLNPASQVSHRHDEFTGHDVTALGFEVPRSFNTAGHASIEYVDGETAARLKLEFQGSLDHANCHNVDVAVDGAPATLGVVEYKTRTSGTALIEDLECEVPVTTLNAFMRAQIVAIRVCKDPYELSWVERDGLKEFARQVLVKTSKR